MPHASNVDAPIVLVGPGRSGTSLISGVLAGHPECSFVGETANLIFGIWTAFHASASLVPPLVENGRTVPDDERAGRLVRHAFQISFPDDQPRWMQKPIGVPNAIVQMFGDDPGSDEAAAMYWRVLRSSFPRARFFTILRHPCDVVLSGVAHWGQDEVTLWRRTSDMARFITWAGAPPVHAVLYEDLVRDPEATVRRLCDAVDLEFHPAMLAAFGTVHVPAPGREDPSATTYSRRHEWSALDPSWVEARQRASIGALFAKYGRELEWPSSFNDGGAAPRPVLSDTARIAELEALIEHMKASFERRRLEYEERTRLREAEVASAWKEQREWIAELEKGKAWLEEQMHSWRGEAERMKASFERQSLEHEEHTRSREEEFGRVWKEQRDWIAELEKGKAWLEEQMRYWRGEAERLQRESSV